MSDETKLLPCPFCGGIASYYASRENVFSARWTGHVVHCLECQARVQTVGGKDDAFTYWNRRAAPSQGDALRESLRRMEAQFTSIRNAYKGYLPDLETPDTRTRLAHIADATKAFDAAHNVALASHCAVPSAEGKSP